MSERRRVIAKTSFGAIGASGLLAELSGQHPAVVPPGVIRQGTELYADDPIVIAYPTKFVDSGIVPGSADQPPRARVVARGLTEHGIRQAVADIRQEVDRAPTRAAVAERLHTSEATLKRAMQDLKMGRWPPAAPED
jgi:hypothetical protein